MYGKRNSGLSARIFVSDDTRPCGPGYGILALWAGCDGRRKMCILVSPEWAVSQNILNFVVPFAAAIIAPNRHAGNL
jgi:hypothetical protein